jgi:hypothetical protein
LEDNVRILKLADECYCIAEDGFVYKDLEKIISDRLHLKKNSFADVYSKKIFKAFLKYAKDLKKEYMEYYQQEYESFFEYLYKKELLDWQDIDNLNLSENQTLLKLNIKLTSYNAENLISYEEKGMDILNKALKEMGL